MKRKKSLAQISRKGSSFGKSESYEICTEENDSAVFPDDA